MDGQVAMVRAAAAAMTARFERFVEDPGLLESIDYRERSKEAYPLIEGVGLIAAEKKRFRGLTMPEDRGMAMMMWRGEQVRKFPIDLFCLSNVRH